MNTAGSLVRPSLVFGDWSNEVSGFDLAVSNVENFNIVIAGGTFAIGFDMHEPLDPGPQPGGCDVTPCVDSPFTIEIFSGGLSGTSLGVFNYNAPDDSSPAAGGPLGFFGLHSSVSFDAVKVREVVPPGTNDNEYFGNFLTSGTALSVSEPGSLALAGLSPAALGLSCRRRAGSAAVGVRLQPGYRRSLSIHGPSERLDFAP